MKNTRQNRLQFDDNDDQNGQAPEELWSDTPPAAFPADTQTEQVYLDDYPQQANNPATDRSGTFRLFLFSGIALLLILGIGFGVYYKFFSGQMGAAGGKIDNRAGEHLAREKIYTPRGEYSNELQKAIGLFNDNNIAPARRAFENFENNPENPAKEKSVALIYQGISHFNNKEYGSAIQYFLMALTYDKDSVPALVNLSLSKMRMGKKDEAREYADQALRLAPSDEHVKMLIANMRFRTGDNTGAIDDYRKGLEDQPSNPDLNFNLGVSLMKEKRYVEAETRFRQALEGARGTEIEVRSLAYLSTIYHEKQKYEIAADFMFKASKLAPANAMYKYNLGAIYTAMNRPREAARYYTEALEGGSNNIRVWRGLAAEFERLDQPEKAIQALRKGLSGYPDDKVALFQLADLYQKQKSLTDAEKTLRRIANKRPADADVLAGLVKLGMIYAEMERYDLGIAQLKEALRLKPNYDEALYYLGVIYRKAGKGDMAAKTWRKALNAGNQPGAMPLSRTKKRTILLETARAYFADGKFEQALQSLKQILAMNKQKPAILEDPAVQLEIGLIYRKQNLLIQAENTLKQVVAAEGVTSRQQKTAYMNLALTASAGEQPEDLERAKVYAYRAASIRTRSNYDARILQASILVRTDSITDRDRAIMILRAVTASDTTPTLLSQAHTVLGRAYYKNGDFDRSVGEFEAALELNPSNREAEQHKRRASNALEQSMRR